MINYYTAETDISASVNNPSLWQATSAKTEAGAKRVAQAARAFQGTAAHVGILRGGEIVRIATRYPTGHIQAGLNNWGESQF